MPTPFKVERNKQLVMLRKKNPEKYTFRELAKIFKIDVRAVWEIYQRDKDIYGKKSS